MANINLLPWREERRKQRQQEFYVILGAALICGLLAFGAAIWIVGQWQSNQDARNQMLRTEIASLDRQIKEIEELEARRARMLERKQVIEDLQKSRSEIVHLFDQLVRTIPEGVKLDSIQQQGKKLTLAGNAESNAKVSAYMRSLEDSQWMRNADLQLSERGGEEDEPRQKYDFRLTITVGAESQLENQDDEGFDG